MQSADEIQGGAKAFYTTLLELLVDFESFQNEVCQIKPFTNCCGDLQEYESKVKRLQSQLSALLSQVTGMKLEVATMRDDAQSMRIKSEGDCVISPGTVVKVENTDDNSCGNLFPEDTGVGLGLLMESECAADMIAARVKSSHDDPGQVNQAGTATSSSKLKKCHICGVKIYKRSSHMQKYHPGERNFPCRMCESAFDNFKEFQNHKKSHKKMNSTFKCDLCNAALKSLRGLSKHMISHCEKPYYASPKTSLASVNEGLIFKEVFESPGFQFDSTRKKSCDYFLFLDVNEQPGLKSETHCAVKPSQSIGIKKPCILHRDKEKIFKCELCLKSFVNRWELKQHMNIHIGRKPFECEHCDRKFYTSRALGRHRYVKHSGRFQGYKCKICGQMCQSVLGREAHYLCHTHEEQTSHGVVVKMSKCDICGKVVRRNYLTNHKLSHLSKAFVCKVCGKGFRRAQNLKTHEIVHMDPQERLLYKPHISSKKCPGKKYVCSVCGKACPSRAELNIHNRVHTDERPYLCDICGKSYRYRQSLQTHEESVHFNIKPFKCSSCGACFASQANLRRHSLLHTGQRPYQCDICGKRFVQKAHLECHRRIHTGEKPFQCNHCGKKFSDPSTLYKHKTRHEKDLPHAPPGTETMTLALTPHIPPDTEARQ